jgi:hypothetical protein
MGSAAFLAPAIGTSPRSGVPPVITILSMGMAPENFGERCDDRGFARPKVERGVKSIISIGRIRKVYASQIRYHKYMMTIRLKISTGETS